MDISLADFEAILPVLVLMAGAMAVLLVDLFLRPGASRAPLEAVAYLALLAAIVLTRFWRLDFEAGSWFGGAIREDMLSRMIGMAVLAASVMFVLLSTGQAARRNIRPAEFLSLALFSAAGMLFLSMSADLVVMFISIEIMSLAVYVLTGMARSDRGSNEAAAKYFVNGSFASAFLLFGMALVYGATGTFQLNQMTAGDDSVLAAVGLTLMIVGFGFKVGAVPFHFWVPDVYQGAPTAVTAFMSVAVKAAGFAALMRFVGTAFPMQPEVWREPLEIVAALTMIVGNVMAVMQDNVKRMLAYSSVAHTGYALIGVVAATQAGVQGAVFYLFIYTFMTMGAFAFLAFAGQGKDDAERIGDYAGLARRRPWAAAAMTLFMVSLAGIPPTAGFFGKFTLFKAGIEAGLYGLIVLGVITTAVSVYYYVRVVVYMYMKEPEGEAAPARADVGALLVLIIACIAIVALGLWPTSFLGYSEAAARFLGP